MLAILLHHARFEWSRGTREGTTEVTLSQERYFEDAEKLAAGSQEVSQVPVNLRGAGEKDGTYFALAQLQQTFELLGCSSWVFANAGARGYYRSNYEPAVFAKINNEL